MNSGVNKETRLNIRVKPDFKAELDAIADFHGLSVSSYVHSVLKKALRRERQEFPEAFLKPNPAVYDKVRPGDSSVGALKRRGGLDEDNGKDGRNNNESGANRNKKAS